MANSKRIASIFFSDVKSRKTRTFKTFTKLISKVIIKCIDETYLFEIDETSSVNIPRKLKQFMIPRPVWVRPLSDW